jgi:hypothetical protein
VRSQRPAFRSRGASLAGVEILGRRRANQESSGLTDPARHYRARALGSLGVYLREHRGGEPCRGPLLGC